jgi:uncharacterized protein YbaP (TraB family)
MILRRLALAALLLLAPPAFAADCGGVDLSNDASLKPDFAAHADDMLNSDGLLWRLDKTGLAPSYLYGTMHSTQPGPMKLAREAAPYAEKASAVATELGDLDPSKKIEIGAKMLQQAMSPDADTWSGLIEGDDARRVETMLTAKGTPSEMAHHLKLWMLAVAASLPACELEGQAQNLPEVDQSFSDVAKAHKIPVIALESIDEQMKVIGAITPELAAAELKSIARGGPFADGGYATLLSLYAQKRPSAILPLLDAVPGVPESERRATAELTQKLLADRNDVMAGRAAPLLAKGGAFIAVGALHLSGKRGLVELFRAQGFTATRVW